MLEQIEHGRAITPFLQLRGPGAHRDVRPRRPQHLRGDRPAGRAGALSRARRRGDRRHVRQSRDAASGPDPRRHRRVPRAIPTPARSTSASACIATMPAYTPVPAAVRAGRARAARRADHQDLRRPGRQRSSSTSASSRWRSGRWPEALRERTATIQTVGGCGALRIGAELLHAASPGAVVHVSDPTWANHEPLLGNSGLALQRYPYYDPATRGVAFEPMLGAPRAAAGGDGRAAARLLPQPDGRRPRASRNGPPWPRCSSGAAWCRSWTSPTRASATTSRPTSAGLRLLAARLPTLLLAISCSKNFGLYRERTGALAVVAESAGDGARDRHAPGAHRPAHVLDAAGPRRRRRRARARRTPRLRRSGRPSSPPWWRA